MSVFLSSDNNGYYFLLYLPTGSPSENENVLRFTERPSLRYGGDNIESEVLFFPGNVKVEFYSDFPGLFDLLYDDGVILLLYEDGDLVFTGYLDTDEVMYVPDTGEYSLVFIDRSKRLKDIPYTAIGSYIGNNTSTYVTEIIDTILQQAGISLGGIYGSGGLTVESTYYLNGEYVERDFLAMATFPSYFFGGYYKSLWDILFALIRSFGFIGYFRGNVFKMRFMWDSTPPAVISNAGYGYEAEWVSRYDVLTASVRTGSGSRESYVINHIAVANGEPNKEASFDYEVPAGTLPGGSTSFVNLLVYLPAYIVGLGNEGFYYARGDTAEINGGGAKQALWRKIFEGINARIGVKRKRVKAEIFRKVEMAEVISFYGEDYIVTETRRKLGESLTKITAVSL